MVRIGEAKDSPVAIAAPLATAAATVTIPHHPSRRRRSYGQGTAEIAILVDGKIY